MNAEAVITTPAFSALRRPGAILIVGNFLSASRGIRCACEELADRLDGAGWDVVTASDKPRRVARLADMLATAWTRRGDYDAAQVDVYSGPSFVWAEAVCGLLRALNKPHVLVLRGGHLPAFARRHPNRMSRLLRQADRVVAPSAFLAEKLKAYRSDLTILPNAIQIDQYPFRKRAAPKPHLMWLRAFHRIYNPSLLPRVVAALMNTIPDVRATMVGPDKQDGSLRAMMEAAARLGTSDRIDVRGAVSKKVVPEVLNEGDVFINTTDVDNMPVSVIEAMACGLCVVSTNAGGMPHLVEHETDGLLVEPDDAEAMANAVRRVLTDPWLAAHLSENARKKAESYDWSHTIPRFERMITSLPAHG